ncbi:MAG: hypothetical protein CL840_09515 [Crocinitomicaceae bacterium]|nr:hypothetical protein [Crocinitomicaceae bacterium]|tara:strand:+ start:18691 stop:19233 length:543 start_codon:yes stop_codon:yes gene_type:complete
MKKFIALILAGALMGCSSNPNEESIKIVDSLLVKVKQADEELSSVNINGITSYVDTITFDVKFIQQEYKDTMTLDLATKVDVYHRLVKSIYKFEKNYNAQKDDIAYSKKQLLNLKSDLNSGVMDSGLLAMYLPAETEAVNRLLESNSSLKIWFENIESGYSSRRPSIDSLIQVIKEEEGY